MVDFSGKALVFLGTRHFSYPIDFIDPARARFLKRHIRCYNPAIVCDIFLILIYGSFLTPLMAEVLSCASWLINVCLFICVYIYNSIPFVPFFIFFRCLPDGFSESDHAKSLHSLPLPRLQLLVETAPYPQRLRQQGESLPWPWLRLRLETLEAWLS